MMVVEVKVCPTAPEKYNHSRKLPSPDFSAIIQTAFLYNNFCIISVKISLVRLQQTQTHAWVYLLR